MQLNRVSTDLLKTFVVFARTGTVVLTAQELGITQAGVSIQLKKLESELKEPLFKAVGRKKVLTDFAKELSKDLEPVFMEIERGLSQALKSSSKEAFLRIGCRPEIMGRAIKAINFKGRLYFSSRSRQEAIEALRNDNIDLAIIQDPIDSTNFVSKKVFEDSFCLVISRDVLKGRKLSSWGQVASHKELFTEVPMIAYKREVPHLEAYCSAINLDPKEIDLRFICEEWRALVDILEQEKLWSLVPSVFCENLKSSLAIPIPEGTIRHTIFYAVYGKHLRKKDIISI